MQDGDLLARPPVLIDVGASGKIHERWKPIAKYSVCIAFDADDRDFSIGESEKSDYLKLYKVNKIVSDTQTKKAFFLTQSPYCSSILEPDTKSLKPWIFSELFKIQKKINLDVTTLPAILRGLKLSYVDWFKTDSQGTDLRLFKSMGNKIIQNTIIAEFEPGIIDAYRREDKMHHILKFMDTRPFWLANLDIRGTQRIGRDTYARYVDSNPQNPVRLRISPCWGEMLYLWDFEARAGIPRRDLLLGWVFATLLGQHGYALEIALTGEKNFEEKIFTTARAASVKELKRRW